MLRLSKLADYAVVVLVRMACTEGCQTSPAIAAMTGLPEPTVAKVLKALAGAGLVRSQRGARGGYHFVRALADVSVADVVAAIDGPVALTACVEAGRQDCTAEHSCPVRGRWDPVNQAVLDALRRVSLADMTHNPVAAHARPGSSSPAERVLP